MISYPVLMSYTNLFSDWFLTLLITACVLAHVACLRSPDVQELPPKEMGRRIKIVGLVIVSLNWWTKLLHSDDITISSASIIGLVFLLFGELLMTVFRLYQHYPDVLPERRQGGDRRVDGSIKVTSQEEALHD